MALDPVPTHGVPGACDIQPLPEVIILDGFAVGGAPVPCLPAMDPFGDAIHHIFAVRVELYGAGPIERFKGLYGGREFHAVVGCQQLTSIDLFCSAAGLEDGPPASRTRIAFAGTISVDDDWGQLGSGSLARDGGRRFWDVNVSV